MNTSTQRTLGCSYSLRWCTGWTHTHPHLQETNTVRQYATAALWWRQSVRQNKWVSDPRRRLCQHQRGIRWDSDRWNCLACSCTDRFHTASCSLDIHRYLSKKTTRRDFDYTDLDIIHYTGCAVVQIGGGGGGRYAAVDLPTQFLPEWSTSNPSLQLHLYVLSMFSHTPFWQTSGSRAHSLISEKPENNLWTLEYEKRILSSRWFIWLWLVSGQSLL